MDTHVKALAVLYLVFSALSVLAALVIVLVTGALTGIVGTAADPADAQLAIPFIRLGGTVVAIYFVGLAVPAVAVGFGLLKLKPWARVLGIALAILSLPHVPVGTALGIYGLWVLLSRDTERLFETGPARRQDA